MFPPHFASRSSSNFQRLTKEPINSSKSTDATDKSVSYKNFLVELKLSCKSILFMIIFLIFRNKKLLILYHKIIIVTLSRLG